MALLKWYFLTELGRSCSVVEVEPQSADHVDDCPLDLGHSHLAQKLLLLEKLELGILKSFQVGPLRLFAHRAMVTRSAKVSETSSDIFYGLVEVEGQFSLAEDAFLLLESLG